MTYPFLKGHGTENDFVLLPDHDGSIHGDLSAARVIALCDRRAGIGGDGVLRVIRTSAIGGPPGPEWFMDYRNADGSVSEMCGNGIRVFARHLIDEGLVAGESFELGTRDGIKTITAGRRGLITVDLGTPTIGGVSTVTIDGHAWAARHIETGNPHAVVFVEELADAGRLLDPPGVDPAVYPRGANVEFVLRRGERHVAMRVHERGSGETRSCGTGACAVAVAAAVADDAGLGVTYRVDVPGGELAVTITDEHHLLLTGPAVIVGRGTTDL